MIIFNRLLIIALALAAMTACSTIKEGEDEIFNDATPPPNYSPVFVQDIIPFDINQQDKPKLINGGVDLSNPNKVKIKLHLVSNNKFYLTGAGKNQFDDIWCIVYDSINGKKQKVKFKISEITELDRQKTAVAFVLDHSGSMGEWRADEVQNALIQTINRKKPDDAFAVIKYDDTVVTEVELSTDNNEILSKFKNNGLNGFGGMTAIANGIVQGIKEVNKAGNGYDKIVVIFTDGYDNSSTIPLDSVYAYARAANSTIVAVDFGAEINPGYMQNIANKSGGFYHHIYSTDEFKLLFRDIYKRIKNHYILEFEPLEYGMHYVTIELCLPDDTIQTKLTFDNTPDLGYIGLLKIYFDFDKATIKKESEPALTAITNLMKGFPNMIIEIRGHTDSLNSTGDPEYNIKLSQKRADAVKKALVKRGIAPDRIIAKGYGETMPVADNSTDEGRALNRRTEFVIIKK